MSTGTPQPSSATLMKPKPMSLSLGCRGAACALAGLAVLMTSGWVHAAEKPPTYEQHVLPIFKEKCCGCHNAGKRAGGLDLTSYQQMQAGGNSGEVLAAGDPDASYLWQVASHESEPVMPPNADRIPGSMLDVIKKWIVGGLLERDGAKPVVTKPATNLALDPGAIVTPEGEPVLPPRLPLQAVTHGIRPTTITGLAASPHGDLVAIGGRRQVLLVSPQTRELRGVLPFPEGDCQTLSFSRNARLLLGGGGVAARSGQVALWDIASGKRLITLGDEYDEVLTADLSADQRLVALGGSAKTVRLLTTADGQVESEITKHTDWITSVAFSPDSVLLATGDRAGNLFLWESFGAREWAILKGHAGGITAIAWRADGLLLASTAEDGTIHLWDADQGKKVRSWNAHGGGTSDVRWLNDGRLVSIGRDRKVKLWKADGNIERDFGDVTDIGTRVVVNDKQDLVIAGDWAGSIEVFALADGKRLGRIDSNPPPLEVRLTNAERELADARKAVEQTVLESKKLQVQAANQMTAAEQRSGEADKQLAGAVKGVADTNANLQDATQRLAEAVKRSAEAAAKVDSDPPPATPEESAAAEKKVAEIRQQAEAAKAQAEAAKAQAEAAKAQAEAAKTQAEAAKTQAEAAKQKAAELQTQAEAVKKEAAAALQQARAALKKADEAVKQATDQATQTISGLEQQVKRWRDEIAFAQQAAASGP